MLCRDVSSQFHAVIESVEGIVNILQSINTLLNPLIGGPNSKLCATNIANLNAFRVKLREQIDGLRMMAANDSNVSRVKLSFVSKLNVILQGQPLRTICLTLENVLIRADVDEICRYGQLASTLLQQITELQNDYEKENELFENEAKKRLETTLEIKKTRLRIENARIVFEKLRPLLNSFTVIRNHLDTISSHCCSFYGESPRVTVGKLDINFQAIQVEVEHFEMILNEFNYFVDYSSPELFNSCVGIASKMEHLITEREIKSICNNLSNAIFNQNNDAILRFGNMTKVLYKDFSTLRINIGKELKNMKLEHVVKPNTMMNEHV